MRVCLLRQYYVPLDPRVTREARALVAAGHQVDVICLRDDGEARRERDGALTIYRLPIPRGKGHPLTQLLGYGAFFLAAAALVAVLHLRRRYDVVQANTVPDALVFAAAVPRLLGAKVAIDLHECMPEFFQSRFGSGPDHPVVRLLARLEQAAIRFAHVAFTVADPQRVRFEERGATKPITVILNGADEDVYDPTRFPLRAPDGEFRLICHGSLEERYGIDTVIEAVALLRDELPGLRFQIYGRGAYRPELEALVRDRGVGDRVTFSEGFVPLDDLVRAIAEADAGVVAMKQDVFRDLTIATKTYEFICMRKPQLMSRTKSVEWYFDDDAFFWFRSDDPADLARAIRELCADPDRRERAVEAAASEGESHRWPVNAARYVSVIEGAARPRNRRARASEGRS